MSAATTPQEPEEPKPPFGAVTAARAGAAFLKIAATTGGMGILFGRCMSRLVRGRFDGQELWKNLYKMAVKSLPIVAVTAIFTGAIMVIQAAVIVKRYNAESMIGGGAGFGTLREIAPLLTALMISGRVGANNTAELGTMVVTEQLDALRVLAIDSIHTLVSADLGSTAGSVAQVRECTTRLAAYGKSRDVIILVIGHVTKDGALAGPKTLEHLVDVVLQFELGEFEAWRELRAHKNRYGSTLEVGSFEMTSSGLRPRDPAAERAPEPPPGALLSLARELLERYLALGGEIDPELGARVEQLRR